MYRWSQHRDVLYAGQLPANCLPCILPWLLFYAAQGTELLSPQTKQGILGVVSSSFR
jgi:hypothetical protein